jgi:hypothetical protein
MTSIRDDDEVPANPDETEAPIDEAEATINRCVEAWLERTDDEQGYVYPPRCCPICFVAISDAGRDAEWDKLRLRELKPSIVSNHVYTCSDEHGRAWQKLKAYRGLLDYRRCDWCVRPFRSERVPKVSIYTYPPLPPPPPPSVPGNFADFCVDDDEDPYADYRPRWGTAPPHVRQAIRAQMQWYEADLCSQACLDVSIHNATEPIDFADVVYVSKTAAAIAGVSRSVDRTAETILSRLASAIEGLAAKDIAKETNLPRTTVQSALGRLRAEGKVSGGGKGQRWLRVVGE